MPDLDHHEERVRDWLPGWWRYHRTTMYHEDWPDLTENETEHWAELLAGLGIHDQAASEPSKRLLFQASRWCLEHAPHSTVRSQMAKVREAVTALRAAATAAEPRPALDRDAAAEASRDCPDCGGTGLAVRYVARAKTARGGPIESQPVPVYDHTGQVVRRIAPARTVCLVLTCVCPLGHWIERQHRASGTGGDRSRPAARLPRLADHPVLQCGPGPAPWREDHRPDTPWRYRTGIAPPGCPEPLQAQFNPGPY